MVLIGLLVLPLIAIAVQRALGLHGWESSLYKLCMIIPPLWYCRAHGISMLDDILKFHQWRRHIGVAIALGIVACAIFWAAYLALGDLLLDKARIGESVSRVFMTNARTIPYLAPVTILLTPPLEEFFYRGFAFGLLVRRNRPLGYLLPAAAFVIQHVLFFWLWMQWIPFCIAVAGLIMFALVQQRLYETADSIVAPLVVHVFGDIALMGVAVALFLFNI